MIFYLSEVLTPILITERKVCQQKNFLKCFPSFCIFVVRETLVGLFLLQYFFALGPTPEELYHRLKKYGRSLLCNFFEKPAKYFHRFSLRIEI